jgi:hypothetical protein
METWKEFRAGDAESITGMSQETQRVKRRRKQLTELEGGKARFNAVGLGELIFVREAAKLGLGTANLTVRAQAANWIAYWALITAEGNPEVLDVRERERVARRLLQLRADRTAVEFALLPIGEDPTWKNVAWKSDADAVRNDRLSVVVNLKLLGQQMASRAGALVERDA